MNRVYRKRQYNIYQVEHEFIVNNTHLQFKDGHTHIKNYNTAKYIIDLSLHRSIPHHLSSYLLESLIRISEDKIYKEKIQSLIDKKNKKVKSFYYNRGNKQKKNYPKRTH